MKKRPAPMARTLWAAAAAAAVLWPGRLAGPFDGAPLGTRASAIVIGLALVALWWFVPSTLDRRAVRVVVVGLLGWKLATTALLAQDGWCVTFTTAKPILADGTRTPHTWDLRGDWRTTPPRCAAVMTRGYADIDEFPTWFFNLPPVLYRPPDPDDRPPNARLTMTADGDIALVHQSLLEIDAAPGRPRLQIDGTPRDDAAAPVAAGIHHVHVETDLSGATWRFRPLLDGHDAWSQSVMTTSAPSLLDLLVRPLARSVSAVLVLALLLLGVWSFARAVPSRSMFMWLAAVGGGLALLATFAGGAAVRASVIALFAAPLVRVPRRLRNTLGAFVLVGIPWLTLLAVRSLPQVGVATWYSAGDDWWMFQRYAYRIFFQGFWIEGGQPTFWYQPLYRWIVGALHVVFGDSSIGELYWDGACVLAGALASFHLVKRVAGFRSGLVAAASVIAMFALGPAWYLLGRGLSETTSAGLLSLAVLFAVRGRHGSVAAIAAAGVCAVAAFYTRLNNLPMALAVAAFALPVRCSAGAVWTPSIAWRRASKPVMWGVLAAMFVGVQLFALRTWHYTGHYDPFYGTQREKLMVWHAGAPLVENARDAISSLLMVLTMTDPPAFDPRSLPILAAAVASVLALARVKPFDDLPLAPVAWFLAGAAGALVSRGSAYPGRFSVHLIPIAIVITVAAGAAVVGRGRGRHAAAPVQRVAAT